MKKTLNLVLFAALAVGLAGTVLAAPPNKGPQFHRAKTVKEISSMKKGDRYVLVCRECESASVHEVSEDADAGKLCHDGGKVHCASCKKDVTIKRVGPPGKKVAAKIEVKYLNAEGKECMILIPLKE